MEKPKVTSDPQAEEQLLSRIFKQYDLLDGPHIMPEAFSVPSHAKLFTLLKVARTGGETPCADIVLFKEPELFDLASKLELRPLGGASTQALVEHLETVRQRRELATLCSQSYEKVMQSDTPASEVSHILAGLDGIRKKSSRLDSESSEAPCMRIMEEWEWRVTNPGRIRGLQFGRPRCEKYIDGYKPGLLYVKGAGTSVGKTTDLCNDLHYFGLNRIAAHTTTMEMNKDELISRLICIDSSANINKGSCANGEFNAHEMAKIQASIIRAASWKHLHWLDSYRLDIDEWAESVRAAHAKHGIQIAYLDYLQCLKDSKRGGDSRAQQISYSAYMGKEIAKELKIPVVMLSQMRRVEGKWDAKEKRTIVPWPDMSLLKESGDIENAADVIELLHRDRENEPGILWRIMAKQRNGAAFAKFKHHYNENCYQIVEQ